MKESILHYIWQQKLFTAHSLHTTDGEAVEVIDVGKLNTDAGPDFFNAKVRIGNTLWAGNVEIHTRASEWYKHNHQHDKAYDSVILHVVKYADTPVSRSDGETIPQLELVYPLRIEENYEKLISGRKWIPCSEKIADIPAIFIQSWKTALLTERLEQKMTAIQQLLNESNQHWEEAFYITLARSFGFGANSQAFEMLAKSLPLTALGKHKNHLFQIEALLFGQAGFLDGELLDEYGLQLKKEYDFLKIKFGLQPINVEQWKLLRLRPDNFPQIRIAQFAALVHGSSKLFSHILERPELEYLNGIFKTEPSDYWKTHYLFGHESPQKSKKLGKDSINSILINTVVPFLFCYATQKGNQDLKDKSIQLLEQIPAEKNAIVSGWQNTGLKVENAFDSQALLQLKKRYCDEKKCLRCRIGHKALTI
ncbi:MAG: DUF2851 family protein [Bacteroidales bacterium]|nr:DUF2851 family protein [Bacteroidales bacterium]